jgi:hypothetical protein
MSLAGTTYIRSGKFNPIRVLIFTTLGMGLAIPIGYSYGLLTYYNPLIYFNFFFLAGAILCLSLVIAAVLTLSHSRNQIVDILVPFLICFVGWRAGWTYGYSQDSHQTFWAAFSELDKIVNYVFNFSNRGHSIGKMGNSFSLNLDGAYILVSFAEFILFMTPIYIAHKNHNAYFCEDCGHFHTHFQGYIKHLPEFEHLYEPSDVGNYTFIEKLIVLKDLDAIFIMPEIKPEIISIDYHSCPNCRENSVVSLSKGFIKVDKNQKKELADIQVLVQSIYIDESTDRILNEKFKAF